MAQDFEINNYMELLNRVKTDDELPNMTATAMTGSDEEVITEEPVIEEENKLAEIAKAMLKGDKSTPQVYSPPPLQFAPNMYHPGTGPVNIPEMPKSPLFASRSSIESAKIGSLNNQIGQLRRLLFQLPQEEQI
jgi:hypothetical protein